MQLNADLLSVANQSKRMPYKAMYIDFKRQTTVSPHPPETFKVYRDDGTYVPPPEPMTREDIDRMHRELREYQITHSRKH